MAESFTQDPLRWFSERGVREMYAIQSRNGHRVTEVVLTMLAAHRQFADIEFLLSLVKPEDLTEAQLATAKEVVKRHRKYAKQREVPA